MGKLLLILCLASVAGLAQSAGPLKPRPKPGKPLGAATPAPAVERVAELKPEVFEAAHEDPVIERAMEYAYSFRHNLPDFLAKQVTTRWSSRNLGRTWKQEDTVEASVVYADGRETYEGIKVNGRPVRSFDSLYGTTSTGEYGTMLRNLFAAETAAGFRRAGEEEIEGRSAAIYELEVGGDRSRWRIGVNDRSFPAPYRGRVWIHEESGEVFRLEMEATGFPRGFPMTVSEITVDYGPVEVGYERALLPVRSANLACFNHETLCRRNEIVFTDYRKFQAETTVDFGNDEK